MKKEVIKYELSYDGKKIKKGKRGIGNASIR